MQDHSGAGALKKNACGCATCGVWPQNTISYGNGWGGLPTDTCRPQLSPDRLLLLGHAAAAAATLRVEELRSQRRAALASFRAAAAAAAPPPPGQPAQQPRDAAGRLEQHGGSSAAPVEGPGEQSHAGAAVAVGGSGVAAAATAMAAVVYNEGVGMGSVSASVGGRGVAAAGGGDEDEAAEREGGTPRPFLVAHSERGQLVLTAPGPLPRATTAVRRALTTCLPACARFSLPGRGGRVQGAWRRAA